MYAARQPIAIAPTVEIGQMLAFRLKIFTLIVIYSGVMP